MKIYLDKLNNKENLTFEESKSAFNILMNGKASEDEIFNFLTSIELIAMFVFDEIFIDVFCN